MLDKNVRLVFWVPVPNSMLQALLLRQKSFKVVLRAWNLFTHNHFFITTGQLTVTNELK